MLAWSQLRSSRFVQVPEVDDDEPMSPLTAALLVVQLLQLLATAPPLAAVPVKTGPEKTMPFRSSCTAESRLPSTRSAKLSAIFERVILT